MYRGSTMALLVAGLGFLGLSSQAAEQAGGMIMLTDGKNMNSFDKAGDANWRIAEGSIAADRGNGYLVTKQPTTIFVFGPSSITMRAPTAAFSSVARIPRNPPPCPATKCRSTTAMPTVTMLRELSSTSPKWRGCRKPSSNGTS